MATIKGNSYSNTLNGTSSADYIYGYGGNDTLNGYGGNDHLYGGDGADKLDGGLGVDWLYGNAGNDILYFGGYGDHYDGGSGTDTLSFEKKTSGWTLNEITSHDIESAGGSLANIEKVIGSNYADTIRMDITSIDGAGGNDQLYGGDGSNNLSGGSGSDYLYGNAGTDYLDGGSGVDWMYGGTGNDTLYFGGYADNYDGGSGTDTLSFAKKTTGWTLDDTSVADAGGSLGWIEKIVGSAYADTFVDVGVTVDGAGGNDHISAWGQSGLKLYGGSGDDTVVFRGQEGTGRLDEFGEGLAVYGGSGNDRLSAGEMTGGTGRDTFVLDFADEIFYGNRAGSCGISTTGRIGFCSWPAKTTAAIRPRPG